MAYSQHIPYFDDKSFTRRHNKNSGQDIVAIKMGGCYVTDKDETISTVLGSCVAACVRDRESGIGGMNHFMLPTYSSKESDQWDNTSVSAATRYGSYAMEYLINSILSKGGKRNNLEFKLFGGGNILGSFVSIGLHNIRFIKEYMQTEGYGVAAESLGGECPMILNYFPKTGIAKIKKLTKKSSEIASIEISFLRELEGKSVEGDIELFDEGK